MTHHILLSLFCFGVAIAPLPAVETANSAIQALRESGRPEMAAALVEVKGEHGEPQPEEWVLLCNDPTAQGGIRELTVKDHHVISERTPVRHFEGEGTLPQLDPTHIIMDSGEVFKATNNEAKNHRIGFDSLNYTLHTDAVTGQSLWIVQLYRNDKENQHLVGTLQFSPETKALIKGL
ncbi:MAG: hypothetical protein ACOYK6_02640 [Chthoniobacterales bacterium]